MFVLNNQLKLTTMKKKVFNSFAVFRRNNYYLFPKHYSKR